MHCGTCLKKFSLMRTKKQCSECRRYYCKYCVTRKSNKNINCEICAVLTSRPLNRAMLLKMKPRDLQCYLTNKQISTKGCIEKEDLVNLLLAYANGTNFQSTSNAQDTHSTGRHLFKNLRSIFRSAPDVSDCNTNSVQSPETSRENTTANSTRSSSPETRLCFNEIPPYYNNTVQSQQNEQQNNQQEQQQQQQSTPPSNNVAEETVPSTTDSLDLLSDEHPSSEYLSQPSYSEFTRSVADGSSTDSDIHLSFTNSVDFTPSERDFIRATCDTMVYVPFKPLNLSDIKIESDLDELSIQQLKYLLIRNRVDFKGCVEKVELLERVKRLWNEYSQSREGLENMPLDDLCKVCMDAPIECVMLECGHMATCTACGKQLSECPICRQYVVRVVRTFRV